MKSNIIQPSVYNLPVYFTPFTFVVLTILRYIEELKNYKWKRFIALDVICGVTISFIHLSHALIFSILVKQHAIYSLIGTIVQVFVYAIFGTCKHISFGTSALLGIMVGETISIYNKSNVIQQIIDDTSVENANLLISVSITFFVGLFQIAASFLHLSKIVEKLLSDSFTIGFLAGTAVHIIWSQLPYFFGIIIPIRVQDNFNTAHSGLFKIYKLTAYLWNQMFINREINQNDFINACSCFILIVTYWIITYIVRKYSPHKYHKFTVIPAEIFVIVISLIVCYTSIIPFYTITINQNDMYDNLHVPVLPQGSIIKLIYVDAIFIAIVSYIVNHTLIKSFEDSYRKKYNSEKENYIDDFQDEKPEVTDQVQISLIDPHGKTNKSINCKFFIKYESHLKLFKTHMEMIGIGISNLISCFFGAFAGTAAPPRSLLHFSIGGKSLFISSFIAGTTLTIITFTCIGIGKYIPYSSIAAIVIFTVLPLLYNLCTSIFKNFCRKNFSDNIQIIVIFLSVVTLNIKLGLLVGLLYNLIIIFQKSLFSGTLLEDNDNCVVYHVPNYLYNATVDILDNTIHFKNKEKKGVIDLSRNVYTDRQSVEFLMSLDKQKYSFVLRTNQNQLIKEIQSKFIVKLV
ncbi:hypothetical protein A3Q56_00612 [Intoshia linei]|uniref:SLC26A/SulP transporter domain-containing protein n=1 Tax=Intoshia linei TaxID=1819745 RepID=A0A177BBD0_9BILA|nr:hypothetical protein A3Q56_00612 [Intoshia linei]